MKLCPSCNQRTNNRRMINRRTVSLGTAVSSGINNNNNAIGMKGRCHRETKLLPCDLWVMTMNIMWGFSIFTFCEELWPKQNYTQFMWGFMEARVQLDGISGGYMHAVFKPVLQQGGEIHHIFLPREAYYSSQGSRIFGASV